MAGKSDEEAFVVAPVGSPRRATLLRAISDTQRRLGRLVLEADLEVPVSATAANQRGQVGAHAVVLAHKIRDLRAQIEAK